MQSFLSGLRVDAALDLRGVNPPDCFQRAREHLAPMAEDQILELHVDEGEVLRTLPYALRADGHEIVVSEPAKEGIRLLVRKRVLPV